MKEYFVGTDDFQRAHKVSAMISANALIRVKDGKIVARKTYVDADRWMLDSGAFSQVNKYGDFIMSPQDYVRLACKHQWCGRLACIVTQDYMCEPDVIKMLQDMGNKASVRIHQRKTVERYIQIMDEAEKYKLRVPVMPVLQGWEVEDYRDHLILYTRMLSDLRYQRCGKLWKNPFLDTPHHHGHTGELLNTEQWIGIGSTCKRNKNPEIVSQILDQLSEAMGELKFNKSRIHLFGYKQTGLKSSRVRDRIYSADSFAYDLADMKNGASRTRVSRIKSAKRFGERVRCMGVQSDLFDIK